MIARRASWSVTIAWHIWRKWIWNELEVGHVTCILNQYVWTPGWRAESLPPGRVSDGSSPPGFRLLRAASDLRELLAQV